MRRIVPIVACLMLLASIAGAAPVAASGGSDVRADLEGTAIGVSEIANFYCYDHDYPRIHCFRTAVRLEASVGSAGAGPTAAAAASDYVIVYSATTYAGSYMYISQNYDTLAWVGWNDRIRSYRGLNGGIGSFWNDWYGTGTGFNFCCNVTVPSLSATFDRQITSVYRR
jgi:hypothetical protein